MKESLGMAFSWVSGEEEMVVVAEKLVDVVLDSSSIELWRGGGGLGVGKCFFLHGLVGKRARGEELAVEK